MGTTNCCQFFNGHPLTQLLAHQTHTHTHTYVRTYARTHTNTCAYVRTHTLTVWWRLCVEASCRTEQCHPTTVLPPSYRWSSCQLWRQKTEAPAKQACDHPTAHLWSCCYPCPSTKKKINGTTGQQSICLSSLRHNRGSTSTWLMVLPSSSFFFFPKSLFLFYLLSVHPSYNIGFFSLCKYWSRPSQGNWMQASLWEIRTTLVSLFFKTKQNFTWEDHTSMATNSVWVGWHNHAKDRKS